MSRDLLFEIGTEEIPSAPLNAALEQLRASAERAIDDARLGYETIETFGSPRRIVLSVSGLAELQSDRTLRMRGPALKAALDAGGNFTKAAEGFARGKGVAVESLERVEDENGAYLYAVIDEVGGRAIDVLPELLAGLAEGLEWPKSMRWGSGDARFSRPVRWLLALLGDEIVPVEFAGVKAGRATRGHRFLAPGEHVVPSASDYASVLGAAFVEPRQGARAMSCETGIEAAMRAEGTEAVVPEKTFAEVVNLVEWPTVAVGTFDEEFLELPREVLETAMEGHQRYFPVQSASGDLKNRFVVVHNGDPRRTDAIVRGHERVIRARLADAAFFYREDLRKRLEAYLVDLESIVFQEKLGTLAAKVRRTESLAAALAALAGAPADEAAFAERAAHLAKADLVTSVVVEFPTLQGVMGGYYALASGEEHSVARAITDHYRPRFSGDALPSTLAGRLVSVSDKLDSICGIFAAGMAPTGSADPYALRRGAIGVLQMILDGLPLTLDAAIEASLASYAGVLPDLDVEAVGAAVRAFFDGRLEVLLKDRGMAYDTTTAVLAVAGDDPADALARAEALQRARDENPEAFEDLSVAFARAKNLAKPELGADAVYTLMGAEEIALFEALRSAEAEAATLESARAYPLLLAQYASLRGPVDEFFEGVLVMDDDPSLRANRLRLLNRFVDFFGRFADFGRIAG
jgi:glycyl-tRNA synthetase beta chain